MKLSAVLSVVNRNMISISRYSLFMRISLRTPEPKYPGLVHSSWVLFLTNCN